MFGPMPRNRRGVATQLMRQAIMSARIQSSTVCFRTRSQPTATPANADIIST